MYSLMRCKQIIFYMQSIGSSNKNITVIWQGFYHAPYASIYLCIFNIYCNSPLPFSELKRVFAKFYV